MLLQLMVEFNTQEDLTLQEIKDRMHDRLNETEYEEFNIKAIKEVSEA